MKFFFFICVIIFNVIINPGYAFSYSNRSKIVAQITWNQYDYDIHCVIEEIKRPFKEGGFNRFQRIVFYKDSISASSLLFISDTVDNVKTLMQEGEYGNLFIISNNGNSFNLKIFSFIKGKIKKVFDEGSKVYPDLFYDSPTKLTYSIFLIDNWDFRKIKGVLYKIPLDGNVFRWDGKQYKKTGHKIWKDRFRSMSK